MLDFVVDNWRDIVSIGGLIASLSGVGWAVYQAHKARVASQSAHKVATQTSAQISQYLQTVSLERALASVQRVKLLHRFRQWEASLEQCQVLRTLIREIRSRLVSENTDHRENLSNDQARLRTIEREIVSTVEYGIEPELTANFYRSLDQIQTDLEGLVIVKDFGNPPQET